MRMIRNQGQTISADSLAVDLILSLRSYYVSSLYRVPSSTSSQSFQIRAHCCFLPTVMSAAPTHHFDMSHKQLPQIFPSDEYKASYDDLIDDYSAPYAPNARHQTFTIGAPNTSHRRGNSASIQKDSSFSMKHSDDTHDNLPPLYPPTNPVKEKDVDTRTIWQKVCGTQVV